MQLLLKIGARFALLIALTACATTPTPAFNHLDPQARPIIKKVDSVLIATQSKVGADINTSKISRYIQGHPAPILLDIGINSVRSIEANKLAKPMRGKLSEYDLAEQYRFQLKESLVQSDLEGAGSVKLLRDQKPLWGYVVGSDADAVMFVTVDYSFSPEFDRLNMRSGAIMVPVNPALSPFKEVPDTDNVLESTDNIYRNQFGVSLPIDMPGTKAENAAKWAEVSKERFEEILNAMALRLADAFSEDLGNDSIEIVKLPETLKELKLDDVSKTDSESVDPNLVAYEKIKSYARQQCRSAEQIKRIKTFRSECIERFLNSYFEDFDKPELEKIHDQQS